MSTIKVNTIQNASGVEQYTCKAWVNFNGTGTVAIRGSGNVSSVTDSGLGDYTINFTTALPDSNYSLVCSAGQPQSGAGMNIIGRNMDNQVQTTTAVRIYSLTTANSVQDNPNISVSVFR